MKIWLASILVLVQGAGLRVLRDGLNIINIIKNRVNQLLAGQSCFFFEVLLALLAFFSYDIFAEIFYTKEAI